MKKAKKQKTVQDSDYSPRWVQFKSRGRTYPEKLLLGYEGEVECRRDDSWEHAAEVINQYDYLYAKEDGSLDTGCEINTHPFNMNWYIRHRADRYFDDVAAHGFYAARSCGFHIHLSKNYFTDAHLAKMVKLFYGNPNFLYEVSQRTRDGLFWAQPNIKKSVRSIMTGGNIKEGDPDTKVNFDTWNTCRAVLDILEDYDFKETALNLIHKKTVEIRIFQGTINRKLIRVYLEFCIAATLYTKTTPFLDVSLKGFRGYVRKNRKIFKSLFNSNMLWGKVRPIYRWNKVA